MRDQAVFWLVIGRGELEWNGLDQAEFRGRFWDHGGFSLLIVSSE